MKPTAILTGDWHLREDTPKCRTDDFWKAQWKKVEFISKLQEKYSIPILHSGDLFHHWKPSPRLISWCIDILPFMYVIPGNHDLPNHNLKLLEKSGLWTLEKAEKIRIWQTELGEPYIHKAFGTDEIAIIHKLINHPQSDTTAKGILKKYKKYNLILTGDNHIPFSATEGGRLLVNPGSLSRQTADQIDHKPCVVLWDNEGHIQPVELPIEKGVISRNHLQQVEDRDERMDAFVSKLNDDYDIELSFEKNIEAYFESNRTRKIVKELVYESMENQ